MTFGSDSLFADKANTKPGSSSSGSRSTPRPTSTEGARPELAHAGLAEEGSRTVRLGDSISFKSKDADRIKKMRLIRPSSFTHVTNVDQRSIALDFEKTKDGLTVSARRPVAGDARLVHGDRGRRQGRPVEGGVAEGPAVGDGGLADDDSDLAVTTRVLPPDIRREHGSATGREHGQLRAGSTRYTPSF